jgi:hypothetical protein
MAQRALLIPARSTAPNGLTIGWVKSAINVWEATVARLISERDPTGLSVPERPRS